MCSPMNIVLQHFWDAQVILKIMVEWQHEQGCPKCEVVLLVFVLAVSPSS